MYIMTRYSYGRCASFWSCFPLFGRYMFTRRGSSKFIPPSGIFKWYIYTQTTWKKKKKIESHYWHLLFFLVYNNNRATRPPPGPPAKISSFFVVVFKRPCYTKIHFSLSQADEYVIPKAPWRADISDQPESSSLLEFRAPKGYFLSFLSKEKISLSRNMDRISQLITARGFKSKK